MRHSRFHPARQAPVGRLWLKGYFEFTRMFAGVGLECAVLGQHRWYAINDLLKSRIFFAIALRNVGKLVGLECEIK